MRDERAFLFDMLESARYIQIYISGMTFESFASDRKTQDAVLRRFTIIGEAAKHISTNSRQALPALPFKDMAGMRDVLMHDYWRLKLRLIWETIQNDLPPLIAALEPLLPPPLQA